MIDQIVFTSNTDRVTEGSRLNVTAAFRDMTTRLAAAAPTTVDWSVINPDDGRSILARTTVAPAASVTLVTTAAMNTLQDCASPSASPSERREIAVVVDRGLTTQFVGTYRYTVANIGSINP